MVFGPVAVPAGGVFWLFYRDAGLSPAARLALGVLERAYGPIRLSALRPCAGDIRTHPHPVMGPAEGAMQKLRSAYLHSVHADRIILWFYRIIWWSYYSALSW